MPGQLINMTGWQADEIRRRVRGDGWFVIRRSLAAACAEVGADCQEFLPRASCIEAWLRSDFVVTRERADGGVITYVTEPGSIFDADANCREGAAPDSELPGGSDGGGLPFLPRLPKGPGVSLALVGLVGALGFAWWKLGDRK